MEEEVNFEEGVMVVDEGGGCFENEEAVDGSALQLPKMALEAAARLECR